MQRKKKMHVTMCNHPENGQFDGKWDTADGIFDENFKLLEIVSRPTLRLHYPRKCEFCCVLRCV